MTALPDDRIPPDLAVDEEPFTLDRLDVHMDDPVALAPEVAAFQIDSDDLAEWAMAHVAEIDAGLRLLEEQTEARLARIRRHSEAASSRLLRRREFFEAHLVAYAREFRSRDPKRNKTLSLPSGRVSSVESQAEVTVRDDEAVAAWARSTLPDDLIAQVVKVTTKVLVPQLRKHAEVAQRACGIRLGLDCEHQLDVPLADENGEATIIPTGADDAPIWRCPFCEPDPIEGEPARTVVHAETLYEPVVRDALMQEIPGAEVAPGRITFTVQPS